MKESKYQGEEIPWDGGAFGAPVELSEETRKKLTWYKQPLEFDMSIGTYKTEPFPAFGVVTGATTLLPYLGEGKFSPQEVELDRYRLPKTAKKLTGTFGRKLEQLYLEGVRKNVGASYENRLFPISGSDPEIFAVQGEQVIPAWEWLPSEKEKSNRTAPFWDGFQAEWNVNEYTCLEQVHGSIARGIVCINIVLQNKFPGAKLSAKSTVRIPKELLATLPEKYVIFGCNPSYNAYDEPPVDFGDPRKVELRTAGGHVHFGTESLKASSVDELKEYVKWIDAFAGVATVALMDGLDDPERRKLYGRAGEFRKPSHGLEYRVLSNGWLRHPALYHLTFELCRIGVNLRKFTWAPKIWDTSEGEVRECINSSDAILARKIIERNKTTFVGLVRKAVRAGDKDTNADAAYKVVMSGIGEHLKETDAVVKNWGGTIQLWSYAAHNILRNTKI